MDSISDDEKKVLLQYRTLNIFGKKRINELSPNRACKKQRNIFH